MMTNLLNGAHVANKLFSTIARLRLLLVMFVALTVSAEVWADYTITFKTGNGSVATTTADIISSGGDYVSSVSAEKTYAESDGLRYGNGSEMGYTTFTLSNKGQIQASKIIFQGAKYYSSDNSSLQYTITYTDATTTTGTIALTSTATDKEATLESSKTISKIDIRKIAKNNKRFYVQGLEIVSAVVANHTVTFDAGSGSCSTPHFTQTSTTRSIDLPSASTTCEGWTFAGWAEASVATETAEAPSTLYEAGDTYKPTSNITLYAVYKRTEEGEGGGEASLTEMVANNTLSDGDKIVVIAQGTYSDEYYNVAMYQETVESSYVNKWDCSTLTADVVADDDKNWWTVTMTDGGFYLGDDTNGYLNMSSNNLYCNANKSVWTLLDLKDGTFKLQSNSRNLSFRADLTNKYWRMGGKDLGTSGLTVLKLYKYTEGTTSTTYYHSTPDCGSTQPSRCVTPKMRG